LAEEKDLFEEAFGPDAEKITAQKRLQEKIAKKMSNIGKNKNMESNSTKENDSEEAELFIDKEMLDEINKTNSAGTSKKERTYKNKDIENESEIFEEDENDDNKTEIETTETNEKEIDNKKESEDDESDDEKNENEADEDDSEEKDESEDSEEENPEEKKLKNKATGLEKNIIKTVIKNKALKFAGFSFEDEQVDNVHQQLLKESGTKEKGVSLAEVEKKVALLEDEPELEDEEEGKKSNSSKITPKLSFLTSEKGNAFLGRKKSVLSKYGEEGGLFLGKVYEDDMKDKNILLDGLNPHVVFVCGARGSGKSYVLGVVAEELAIKNKNVGIVVVDPIGVFWSMKHPNKEEKELELLAKWEMMPRGLDNVKVFIPVGMKDSVPKSTYDAVFSIQPALLTAEDWCLTFGIDRFSPTGLLMEKAISKAKTGFTTTEGKKVRGKENTFSLDELIECLETEEDLNDKDKGYKADSIRALISRFDAAKHWGIFDEKGTPLSLLSKAGQMTILDTSFLDDSVSALVIGIIARRLLSARKLSTRREAAGKFDDSEEVMEINVPPTWLFIDEAHTLIPGGNQKTPASSALVEYVKQGRRPGCSLVFATQQPSAIDSRVLSQLDIIMAHKLVFDDDIKSIYKRTPAIIPWQYKKPSFIKTMPIGIALTGDRNETTTRAFIMGIRPRMSQHEGRDAETIEVKKELDEPKVEMLIINITLKKLEKDPKISIDAIQEIIESLNSTYKKNIKLEKILTELTKKGVEIKDNYAYATGVLKEIQEEALIEEKKKIELEKAKQTTNIMGEIATATKGKILEKVELLCFAPKVGQDGARKIFDSMRQKKVFGFLGGEESIESLTQKHAPVYKIKYKIQQKGSYRFNEAFVNSITGEFMHYSGNTLKESKGLRWVLDSGDAFPLLKVLSTEKKRIKDIAKRAGMKDEKEVAKLLFRLEAAGLVKEEKIKKPTAKNPSEIESVYSLVERIDLPEDAMHDIMPSMNKAPMNEIMDGNIEEPRLTDKEAASIVEKLWTGTKILEISTIFLPIWEATLKKANGQSRVEIIEGINGKKIKLI
jgi:hypothetical protein